VRRNVRLDHIVPLYLRLEELEYESEDEVSEEEEHSNEADAADAAIGAHERVGGRNINLLIIV
jgi:hypothetical protein